MTAGAIYKTRSKRIAGVADVLSFEAPYLIDKLVKEGVADTAEESAALFTEVKRYLCLTQHHADVTFAMYSRRVDAAWHAFVLFTEQYAEFGQQFFGGFLHHAPSEAPRTDEDSSRTTASFAQFCEAYESMFGEAVPDLWRDHMSIKLHRRIMNRAVGELRVEVIGDEAMLLDRIGTCHMVVNALAAEALRFVTATPYFHVRELPGELTDEEKIGLVETFVQHEILNVG